MPAVTEGRPPHGFWRKPGAAGLALVIVSVPLVILARQAGAFVAFAAMCLYPILDVPRTLGRRSWWVAAAISVAVWIVVFVVLAATADAVGPIGEAGLIFVVPIMTYPIALVIAGLVRLERRLRGRPAESGQRIAFILCTVACGLFVGVPIASNFIPPLYEGITGNTIDNFLYSEDGEVTAFTPGKIDVRMSTGKSESFAIGPDTKFDFRGPGSAIVTGTAGPDWLKPGQRIELQYVYRDRVAQASAVNIWIDRKGCKGDAAWIAATEKTTTTGVRSLAGTAWESVIGPREAGRLDEDLLEFQEGDRLTYGTAGAKHTDGHWRQDGAAVVIEVNDCYAVYTGQIAGDEIKGQFSNEVGRQAIWTARRRKP
jgi:uncharacterized membrane protein YhaH (DUF805 family)